MERWEKSEREGSIWPSSIEPLAAPGSWENDVYEFVRCPERSACPMGRSELVGSELRGVSYPKVEGVW